MLASDRGKDPTPTPLWSRAVPAYGVGILAAYWCLERTVSLFQ